MSNRRFNRDQSKSPSRLARIRQKTIAMRDKITTTADAFLARRERQIDGSDVRFGLEYWMDGASCSS